MKDKIWEMVFDLLDVRYADVDKKKYKDELTDIENSIEELASAIEYDIEKGV